jgi:hypothetical protein
MFTSASHGWFMIVLVNAAPQNAENPPRLSHVWLDVLARRQGFNP